MNNNRYEFGHRLRAARKNKGLSGYKLAMMLDVESPNITHWENGRNYPGIDKLIRLSEMLGVSIDWLLMGQEVNHDQA